jgi:hypothetical protein
VREFNGFRNHLQGKQIFGRVKKAHFTLLIVADYGKVWEMVDSIYSILTFRLPSMSVEARLRVGGE